MTTRPFGHIRKLPSGAFQASYPGPDGKRHTAPTTYRYRTHALDYLKHQQALIQLGQWAEVHAIDKAGEMPTFGEYCQRHITIQTTPKGNLLKPSTVGLYERLLRTHLDGFAPLALDDITVEMVNNWWAKSISEGRKTMASKAYKLLSAVFTRAIEEGKVTFNPCRVKGAQSATTGKRVIIPSIEDVRKLVDAINPRYKTMVLLLASSGLRFGEATAITRADLIPAIRSGKMAYNIQVNKAVAYTKKQFILGPPKSEHGNRTVKLKAELTAAITKHLGEMSDTSPDALVFPAARGGYLRNDVFTNSFKPALKRAGVDGRISPHCLRHFAGSEYGRTGANLAELKDFLGDSSTTAVVRYLHATDRSETLLENMRTAI